eukprot:TRINITY_DN7296_c0_g1_i1.p1 TRINITY_DN7296_c0_g1~~TRINITY_DN7296_c0_g1_i1.p1  ORF type:complete len:786 (-),score=151.58 TRINITY_DN7296_c0_g1_i1:36-2177(-)
MELVRYRAPAPNRSVAAAAAYSTTSTHDDTAPRSTRRSRAAVSEQSFAEAPSLFIREQLRARAEQTAARHSRTGRRRRSELPDPSHQALMVQVANATKTLGLARQMLDEAQTLLSSVAPVQKPLPVPTEDVPQHSHLRQPRPLIPVHYGQLQPHMKVDNKRPQHQQQRRQPWTPRQLHQQQRQQLRQQRERTRMRDLQPEQPMTPELQRQQTHLHQLQAEWQVVSQYERNNPFRTTKWSQVLLKAGEISLPEREQLIDSIIDELPTSAFRLSYGPIFNACDMLLAMGQVDRSQAAVRLHSLLLIASPELQAFVDRNFFAALATANEDLALQFHDYHPDKKQLAGTYAGFLLRKGREEEAAQHLDSFHDELPYGALRAYLLTFIDLNDPAAWRRAAKYVDKIYALISRVQNIRNTEAFWPRNEEQLLDLLKQQSQQQQFECEQQLMSERKGKSRGGLTVESVNEAVKLWEQSYEEEHGTPFRTHRWHEILQAVAALPETPEREQLIDRIEEALPKTSVIVYYTQTATAMMTALAAAGRPRAAIKLYSFLLPNTPTDQPAIDRSLFYILFKYDEPKARQFYEQYKDKEELAGFYSGLLFHNRQQDEAEKLLDSFELGQLPISALVTYLQCFQETTDPAVLQRASKYAHQYYALVPPGSKPHKWILSIWPSLTDNNNYTDNNNTDNTDNTDTNGNNSTHSWQQPRQHNAAPTAAHV